MTDDSIDKISVEEDESALTITVDKSGVGRGVAEVLRGRAESLKWRYLDVRN